MKRCPLYPLFAVLALLIGHAHTPATAATPPPNVVLIFVDDMGYGDPEFNGAFGYHTPNMNRLAADGMRFTSYYSTQPVCSAARAALLTGCYANRVGIHGALSHRSQIALNPDETTIASMLKKKGYATSIVGKWHLGSREPYFPDKYGFDEWLGLPYSNDMWPVDYSGAPASKRKSNYPPLPLIDGKSVVKHLETLDDQAELTRLYTERSCDFIRRSKEKPFFLYLAHAMVHVPIAASPAFRGKSGAGLYGDVMMEVDWSIGEVLKTLDETGVSSNTLVIFTSDNGPWLRFGNHAGNTGGLREGKGTNFEGGVRVPCVMRWPGKIAPGTICHKLSAAIDILPTLASLCQADLPGKKIDGVDLSPLLRGDQTATPRRELAYYYHENQLQAVRKDQWKLMLPHRSRTNKLWPPGKDGFPVPDGTTSVPLALYDLLTDPGESVDVQTSNPEVVRELKQLADHYRDDLGDDLTGAGGSNRRSPARLETK